MYYHVFYYFQCLTGRNVLNVSLIVIESARLVLLVLFTYYICPLCVLLERTKKQTALDQSRTDCISLTYDPDLIYDFNLQSPASCGHALLTCKRSRSTVSRFRRQSANKRMETRIGGRTEGQTDVGDCITSVANAVGHK